MNDSTWINVLMAFDGIEAPHCRHPEDVCRGEPALGAAVNWLVDQGYLYRNAATRYCAITEDGKMILAVINA